MSSPQPSQSQRSETPAGNAAERRRQLAEARRLREEAAKKAEEERKRAEEEERREEEELAQIEEEEQLAKERAERERVEREQREKEEREREAAERRRLEEEKEKEAARAKEKGKGRAQTHDESMAGSSRAVSEGSSRKRAREDEEDEDEDEEPPVVKKPRVKRGPTITIRPVMGGERKCQRCHDNGLDCVVATPKDNKQTRSCGPCYEHKKRCQPMKKELNQPLIDINESTMKALIGSIDNLVGIADLMYFRCVETLDLVDEYILWKMGRSSGSSSGKTAEDDEEVEEAEKEGDDMEE